MVVADVATHDVGGAVVAAVEGDVEADVGLREAGAVGVQRAFDALFFVVRGNDDVERHGEPPDGAGGSGLGGAQNLRPGLRSVVDVAADHAIPTVRTSRHGGGGRVGHVHLAGTDRSCGCNERFVTKSQPNARRSRGRAVAGRK